MYYAELALADWNVRIQLDSGFFGSKTDPFPKEKKSNLFNILKKYSNDYDYEKNPLPTVFNCLAKHLEMAESRDQRKRENLDQLTMQKIATLPSKTELHLAGNKFRV